VAADARHRFQNVLPNFVGYGLQLLGRQSPQVGWGAYVVQKMHLRGIVTWQFRFLLLTKLSRFRSRHAERGSYSIFAL